MQILSYANNGKGEMML